VDWSFYSSKTEDASATSQDQEAQDWVSPILNREIRTRIGAHDWGPTITPYNELCEIYTLLQSQDDTTSPNQPLPTAVQFLDLIASPEMTASISHHSTDIVKYSMSVLSNFTSLSQASIRLLEYMVQMRMASPQCELQRTLFESIAQDSAQHVNHSPYASSSIEDSAVTLMIYDDSKQIVRHVDIPSTSGGTPTASEDTEQSLRQWWDQALSQFEASTAPSEDTSERVLPGEVVIPPSSTVDSSTVVIIYGFLGSAQWADVYRKLRALPHLQIVVRHRGVPPTVTKAPVTMLQGYGVRLDIRNVEYKVFDDRSDAVSIQKNDSTNGDLLNVSHIVADRELKSDDVSLLFQYHHPPLAGVNVTKLLEQDDGTVLSKAERLQLQASLWKIHDAQMLASQIIPPIWQRRQLSMQAATVISEGKDPLYSLQHLSQNLPSVASTLVHVKVPDSIVNASTVIAHTRSLQSGLIYLNGRVAASLERPTFNVFELLHQIRQEQAILGRMQSLFAGPQGSTYLPPFDSVDSTVVAQALRDVQKAWMLGHMFGYTTIDEDGTSDTNKNPSTAIDIAAPTVRIDVGRGWKQAVIYLNDIEKDPQYMSWPRSLRQMLMSMQFGMPPTVRRNLFTILAVVDPVQSRSTGIASSEENDDENETVGNVGFDLGMQLIQAQYPARIGLLVASANDIQACADWIATSSSSLSETDDDATEACPVPSIFSTASKPTNILDLQDHPVTTHAIHRLIANFASNDSAPPGALIAFGEYLLSSIRSHRGSFSLYDLVTIHGSLWEGMQIGTSSQGVEDGFQALIKEESSMSTGLSYGKAIRFAADKRLQPGMSFLNGRLLSIDSMADETVSTTFSEEQNHVFGLIMKGEITDTSPKSIYAKLLSGTGLYKKYHPLLSTKPKSIDTESDGPEHLQHQFSSENSLIFAGKVGESHLTSACDALFVVDVFLAYDTVEGLNLAAKFMSLMDSFPTALESSSGNGSSTIGVAYRFMPSSTSASKSVLCPVLTHAGLLGAPIVQRLLDAVTLPQDIDQLDSLLTSIDGVSDDVRATILANSGSDGPCATLLYPSKSEWSFGNALVANGHIFHVEGKSIVQDDLELLLMLELSRTKAVTNLLRKYVALDSTNAVAFVAKVASFLMEEESQGTKRYDIDDSIENISDQIDGNQNPLKFIWNTESIDESAPLQVSS
jgi:Thioredoxin-like domain